MANNNIPKHWRIVVSSDIIDVRDGTHDTPKYVAENGIPLITSKNLKANKIDFEKISYISKEDHVEISKRSKVEEGDILFAMIGTIGNPAIIKGDANFSIKNVGLFKKNERVILPAFLVSFLRSCIFEKQLSERKLLKGTTQKFIPLGNLRNIEIPLPPLPEQVAIVTRIEELFSHLENGKQQLQTAQQQLKVYRQSLLKWAFEGKLTEEWRNEQKIPLSIAAEPRISYETKNNLPDGWNIKLLGDICEIKNGKNQKQVINSNGKYPIYGSAGVMGFADAYLCEAGATIVGRKGTINKPLYVKTRFWNVDTAFGFCPNEKLINRRLLYFFCLSFNFNKLDKSTTIPSLAKTDLQKIYVPVPTIEEQQLIVDELESKLTICDKIEETISQSLQQVEALRQSILKRAFEGRLV